MVVLLRFKCILKQMANLTICSTTHIASIRITWFFLSWWPLVTITCNFRKLQYQILANFWM